MCKGLKESLQLPWQAQIEWVDGVAVASVQIGKRRCLGKGKIEADAFKALSEEMAALVLWERLKTMVAMSEKDEKVARLEAELGAYRAEVGHG